MSETTSGRLLRLLSLLQARRDWAGDELADRLEVSCRTIRRDVERLRTLGYPVESLPGRTGGYRLAAGTAMPPLLLDDEEAIAIAVGLRTAAGAAVTGIEDTAVRALVKLEQVLPRHLRRRVAALGEATTTFAGNGPTVDPQTLATIAAACRDGERLRFSYRGRDGAQSRRDVEPHALVSHWRRWYLVAWDGSREGWRTFRLDRLTPPVPAGARFTPRQVPGGDAGRYVAENISSAPYRYEARVRLHAPATAFAFRRDHLQGTLTPIDAASCEYRTSDDHLEWLAIRLGMLGVDFDVLDAPPELADRLSALADRFARAAGGCVG